MDSFGAPEDGVDVVHLPCCLFFRPSLPLPSAQHCSKVCPGLPHLGFVHWMVDLLAFDFDVFSFCVSLQLGFLDLANMAVTPFSCCIHFSSWRICNMSVLF